MQRHTWARRAPSRRMTLGGLTTLATLLAATPAAATLSDVPSVMVDEINWVAGWFDAFDKPDFFARARLKDALGNIVECGTTPVTQDLLYASPGTVLCNDPANPTPVPVKILRPYSILVEVWEADGPGSPPAITQSEPADLSSAPGRMYGEITGFMTSPTQQVVYISGPQVGVRLTIATEEAPTTFNGGPTLSTTSLDPAFGAGVRVTGMVSDPTPLTWTALELSTGRSFVVAQTTNSTTFDLSWDGRDPATGRPVSYGDYDLTLAGPRGNPSNTQRLVVRPTPPLVFENFIGVGPDSTNIRARPHDVSFTIADDADVTLSITPRRDVAGGGWTCLRSPVIQRQRAALRAGHHTLSWDGRDKTGAWANSGGYCAVVSGKRTSDQRTFTEAAARITVEDPRPIFVDVRTNPEVPALVPGLPVQILARAFDDRGQPRPVAQLDIDFTTYTGNGRQTPLAAVASCRGVEVCTVAVPAGAGGTIALRARAQDNGDPRPTTGSVRLVDLVAGPPGTDIRVSVAAVQDGPTIQEVRRTHAVDIAYHRSADFVSDGGSDVLAFPSAVGLQIDAVLGLNGRGPSAIHEFLGATSFWAVSTPAQVRHGGNPFDWNNDLCVVDYAAWSTSADVNGVLHLLDCRDNASSSRFTSIATQGNTGWHELHHRPFGEADEYCCDGGYGQNLSEPNLYLSLAMCQMYSSSPGTCTQVTDITVTPPATVNFWVSDPVTNDVMNIGTGIENADDLRRVRAHYTTCARGGC